MIIDILKQPKDSYLLSTSGLKDQSMHIHPNRPTDHSQCRSQRWKTWFVKLR